MQQTRLLSRLSACALCAFGALALASACSADTGEGELTGTLRHPIIGGAPDPNETGVVYVTHQDYPFLCSGTLIGSNLVVTAKHCTFVEKSGADQPMAGNRFRVGFGPKLGQMTFRGTTKMEWIGQPGNVEVQDAVDAGEDVVLLWLSSAAPAGSIIHKVKLDYVPQGGDQLTIVGYGKSTLSGGTGTKRMTVDAYNGVNGATGIVQAKGKGACSGDSGGAFFFGGFPAGPQRELVGVTSTAGGSSQTQSCDIGITNASTVRNPKVSKFLADALGIIGVCAPSAEICGDGKDQDCDGVPDNQCKKDGEACASEVDCESGQCADTGSGKVCVRFCDDKTPCPAGNRCVTTCTQGYCSPGQQGTGKLLESCTDASECISNHCSAAGCSSVCNPVLGQCPDDMACAASQSCGECLPLAQVPAPRALGERCETSSDCVTDGTCLDDGFGVKRCATPCLEGNSCASGFLCRAGYCVRGGGFSNGERCTVAEDCGSFLCAAFNYPELNYCTKLCSGAAGCPIGFACKNELGAEHCVPTDLRLGDECIADSQCLSGRCDEGLGVCIRKCDPKTTPCPPGFACHVYAGELACVPAAVAASLDGGLPGSGGFSGGGGGPGGSSGAAGSAQAGAANGDESSGCGCRVAPTPSRGAWLLTLPALFLLRRRRRR